MTAPPDLSPKIRRFFCKEQHLKTHLLFNKSDKNQANAICTTRKRII